MLSAPNLSALEWLTHGFGERDSVYPNPVTTVKQIHSDIVIEPTAAGGHRVAEGDALVVRQPGMVVGVRTADCVPVLLADPRTHAVSAIHAGWRGSAKNISARSVQEMAARYGSRPEDLVAAIGPSIGPCCYEVGSEVGQQFQKWTVAAAPPTPVHLDLPAVNEAQLLEAGVRNIWKAGVCTFCEIGRYFSFRREKEQAGRMLSFVGDKAPKNTSGGAP